MKALNIVVIIILFLVSSFSLCVCVCEPVNTSKTCHWNIVLYQVKVNETDWLVLIKCRRGIKGEWKAADNNFIEYEKKKNKATTIVTIVTYLIRRLDAINYECYILWIWPNKHCLFVCVTHALKCNYLCLSPSTRHSYYTLHHITWPLMVMIVNCNCFRIRVVRLLHRMGI